MATNVIMFGWNRAHPGRESAAMEQFQEFAAHLGALQSKGEIDSFEPILFVPGGGTLNGFFLIRGDHGGLDALMATDAWRSHVMRSMLHLDGLTIMRGSTGEALQENLGLWAGHASKLARSP
ncbi:hypothetical protein [Noviherbaspirillum aerium]|uniref:hypothetical protein n=1 Tax=Noviherbaspirillum aerium TaxID=2588497 RepID=UPI00124BE005|nr:hypothetical protein [Noviherbaspirillum aerium]